MTATKTPAQVLTCDQARALAGDLLRVLTPLVGDREAINTEMSRWLDLLDYRDLSLVCIAAVHTTFVDCLTPTPLDQAPPGALTYTDPEENHE